PPPPVICSVEVTWDCTLEKSGLGCSVLCTPPWTLEKSGFLSLLIQGLLPGYGQAPRWHARREGNIAACGPRSGNAYWRGVRTGAGGAMPGVPRHGLMSSPPRRV